jgi:hypothetical protein
MKSVIGVKKKAKMARGYRIGLEMAGRLRRRKIS